MTIKVTECKSCPFANADREQGRFDGCNLIDKLEPNTQFYNILPDEGIYDKCPLKTNDIEIQNKSINMETAEDILDQTFDEFDVFLDTEMYHEERVKEIIIEAMERYAKQKNLNNK